MYFTCPYCKTELRIANPKTQIIRGKCPHCGRVLEFDTTKDGIPDEVYLNTIVKASRTKQNIKDFFSEHKSVLILILALVGIVGLFAAIISLSDGSTNQPNSGNSAPQKVIFTISKPNDSQYSLANSDKQQQWNKFRTFYPYNFQTIAAKHYSDDSHVVILSEPANHITIDQITGFFYDNDINVTADSYQIQMGYDGWLKDYVFAVNNIEKGKFDIFIEKLSQLLYGTGYKSYYIDLSTLPNKTYYSNHDLNYSISASELRAWLIDDEEKFFSANDSSLNTIPELLSKNQDALYYSENPGFVVWTIKTGMYQAADFLQSARKFALESDLILGAINRGTNKCIAIIGRERSIPVYELPPLEAEIMLMLATTYYSELHQSYERGHFIAGKLPGGKDFAPILLSSELWHTEYGSLLNITDQMLKSWSENGDVDYEQFHYPKPDHWAFKKGVYTDLNTKNSLTYNWNTAGAGYYFNTTDDCPYRIYAVNRTGSLPVSYIPEGKKDITANDKVFLAEEKAYNYFSHLNNPELVRVVQYASFYQIMQYCKPSISGESKYISKNSPVVSSIYANKREIEDRLKNVQISRRHITNYYDRVYASHYGYQYTSLPRTTKDEFLKEDVDSDLSKLQNLQCVYNATGSTDPSNTNSLNGGELQLFNQIYNVVPLKQAMNEYVQENRNFHSNWIKCPTIVLSWSAKDSTAWTGGHNLNSVITPIYLDNTTPLGKYTIVDGVNGQKYIKINEKDRQYITPDLLRTVNRTSIKGTHTLTNRPIVIRRRDDVLRRTQRRSARGFNLTDHVYPNAL